MGRMGRVDDPSTSTVGKKFFIDKLSTLTAAIPRASVLPTKFIPLSERNFATLPRMATNLLKALIKVGDDISSTSSICTARHVRHVNKIPQCSLIRPLSYV